MKICGKRPALTPSQAREVRRRYWLHLEYAPQRIARDFGISRHTVRAYALSVHKRAELR